MKITNIKSIFVFPHVGSTLWTKLVSMSMACHMKRKHPVMSHLNKKRKHTRIKERIVDKLCVHEYCMLYEEKPPTIVTSKKN